MTNKIVISNPYMIIFLAGTIISFVLGIFLDFTNLRNRKKNGRTLPKELTHIPEASVFDKEKLSKMCAYKDESFYLYLPLKIISFALSLFFVLSGFYPWLFNITSRITGTPKGFLSSWTCAMIFTVLSSLPTSIISLPFELIDEFKIEKKFGFSNMTFKLWLKDEIKSLILGLVLGALIIAAISFILVTFPKTWWIFITVFLFALTLIFQIVYPLFIAPLFNKFTPLEEGELKDKINVLLISQGFKTSGVFVMDASKRSKHSNAYFTGFGKSKRIVLYDTLIKDLSSDEIIAVLAHELGHAKLHHITKKLFVVIPAELVLMFLLHFTSSKTSLYTAFGFAVSAENVVNMQFFGLFLSLMVWNAISLIVTPVSNIFSRKDEYAADKFSAKLTKAPEKLISGLIKLNSENLSELTPSKIYAFWHYSHPTLLERIRALNSYRLPESREPDLEGREESE